MNWMNCCTVPLRVTMVMLHNRAYLLFGKVKWKALPYLWRIVSSCMWRAPVAFPSSFLDISLFELSNNTGRSFFLVLSLFQSYGDRTVGGSAHQGQSQRQEFRTCSSPKSYVAQYLPEQLGHKVSKYKGSNFLGRRHVQTVRSNSLCDSRYLLSTCYTPDAALGSQG